MLGKWIRGAMLALAGGLALASCATTEGGGGGPTPAVEAVPGRLTLLMGGYDVGVFGYRSDEFFLTGTATSYQAGANGEAQPAGTSPYATRIVVTRPVDPSRFNGTVIVEWMNVTGGQDLPADWVIAHRELVRSGYVHVGVSAQRVGVEGGASLVGSGAALKRANPERYGRLSHPGDAYSFDMFSQAGRAVRNEAATVLGGLRPQRLIAVGESQSAHFLVTYVNAVDPLARVYDGFLVHSRFGGGAPLSGAGMRDPNGPPASAAPFRSDLRVPVLTVVTETDLMDGNLLGYRQARVPDSDRLRVWEVAGTAHADNYMFGLGLRDDGRLTPEQIAQAYAPTRTTIAGQFDLPANTGQPHHYVMQAAFHQIDNWLRNGDAPPQAPQLVLTGTPPAYAVDANGNAQGGVRTPWVDVPTARVSGVGNSGGAIGFLAGVTEPFDAAKLSQLYPGGRADYLRRFEAALDQAIAAGFLLQADRAEILAVASAGYPAQ